LHPAKRLTSDLAAEATFFKHIRHGVLGGSQIPDTLMDAKGILKKPVNWETGSYINNSSRFR